MTYHKSVKCHVVIEVPVFNSMSYVTPFKGSLQHWDRIILWKIRKYPKNPKNSDTPKICCDHPKIWTRWLYQRVMHPKDAAGIANSVDPLGAVWSWSALFAQTYVSENLGSFTFKQCRPYINFKWMNFWKLQIFFQTFICIIWLQTLLMSFCFWMDPHFANTKSDDVTFPKSMLLRRD